MSEPILVTLPAGEAAASKSRKFALIGAAGFVARRHLQAIRDTDNELVAAVDLHDSVGILDSFFPDAHFFTEIERFDRFLEKRRRASAESAIDYVSVCSPNYLHDAHVRLAMRVGADAICEKPLVINPWNLDQLEDLEQDYGGRVHTVLQLRLHPQIQALKKAIEKESNRTRREVCLTYITRRGAWYHTSWKGTEEKSGGLAMNIGIHFFDLLIWLFGAVEQNAVHVADASRMAGSIELEGARVKWFLSIDADDLPAHVRQQGGHAFRSLTMDGDEIDLSAGFNDLHTQVYREILAGRGYGIEDARPSIDLVYSIRNAQITRCGNALHPLLARKEAA